MQYQDDIKKLITTYNRRLQKLREQEAIFGISADPKISLEIENIEAKIERLQTQLEGPKNGEESNPDSGDKSGAAYWLQFSEKVVVIILGVIFSVVGIWIGISWFVERLTPATLESVPFPSPTVSQLNPIKLEPLKISGYCANIRAIPVNSEIPKFSTETDVRQRWTKTLAFLDDIGFKIGYERVNRVNYKPEGIYDPFYQVVGGCNPPGMMVESIVVNNSHDAIVIKEVALIVDAYDYEPSSIPDDYKLIYVLPLELGGGEPAKYVPTQHFQSEVRPTTNALRLMHISNTPPIIVKSDEMLRLTASVSLLAGGTFRMHLAVDITDSQGRESTLETSSFIKKWVMINEVDLTKIQPVDVK